MRKHALPFLAGVAVMYLIGTAAGLASDLGFMGPEKPPASAHLAGFRHTEQLHARIRRELEQRAIRAESAYAADIAALKRQNARYAAQLRRAGLDIAELRQRPLDTIYVPVQVLIEADDALARCEEAADSCEVAQQALRDQKAGVESELTSMRAELEVTRKLVPTGWQHVRHDAKVAAVTVGVGYVLWELANLLRAIGLLP